MKTFSATPANLDRLRAAITARLGLQVDEARSPDLPALLARRLAATRLSPEAYLRQLELGMAESEVRALARSLTVPETYFFRHDDQLRAVADVAVPERCAAHPAEKRLRILSLGCASGEEPYSLAIVARTALSDPSWQVTVVGVDVNADVLDKARRGRYSAWSLRQVSPAEVARWFRAEGREFVLDDAIRSSVQFEHLNLVSDDEPLWLTGDYDIVFLRNVIMYFAPAQAQRLIARVSRVLAPHGYLFLGHAETLRGLSSDFHLRHTHGAFYYQRKTDRESHVPAPPRAMLGSEAGHGSTDPAGWADTIRRASDKVAALIPPASPASPPPHLTHVTPDLERVRQQLREGDVRQAISTLDALPPETSRGPDGLLLRGLLLSQDGRLEQAERACQEVLAVDELNASAHHLLSLCREGAGDLTGASYHDQLAAHLDPGFAFPRLHLGVLARREGDTRTARKELAAALLLLEREDDWRIVLFGGGFGRRALALACQTELERCGGTA